MFRNLTTLFNIPRTASISLRAPWDASVCLGSGVTQPQEGCDSPQHIRLLLAEGQWLDSELPLPHWMSPEEVRAEVVLHAQALHDDASVYVDSRAKPTQQDDMQVLTVWSIRQDAANDLWDAYQRVSSSDAVKPRPRLACLTPLSQQHTDVNLLPFREWATSRYQRRSWVVLAANAILLVLVLVTLQWPAESSKVDAAVATAFDPRAARALPELAVLRAQLQLALQHKHEQALQARQQTWQLGVLAALSRDMTAYLSVQHLVAQGAWLELQGQAEGLQHVTGFAQALRARWGNSSDVHLRSSQQQANSGIAFRMAIKSRFGPTPANGNAAGPPSTP